jgi:hypothetical protein
MGNGEGAVMEADTDRGLGRQHKWQQTWAHCRGQSLPTEGGWSPWFLPWAVVGPTGEDRHWRRANRTWQRWPHG